LISAFPISIHLNSKEWYNTSILQSIQGCIFR